MTHKQHPLGTPFTPASTADEVLAGIDLTGRNVIVTGGMPASGWRSPARSPRRALPSRSVHATRSVPLPR